MTISEAIAHDKLLQAFGDRPFGRAEALAVVGEDLLSALVVAGMVDLLEGRLKYAREFLELEKEIRPMSVPDDRRFLESSGTDMGAVAARLGRWPLLRHGREMLELCG